nr:hypothetical protein [uncultured Desulfobacter sp.]
MGKKRAADISSRVGSYGAHKERTRVGGQSGRLSFNGSGGYSESNGYRDNGGLRKKDAALKMGLDVSDTSHLGIELSYLDSKIGLPALWPMRVSSQKKKGRTTRPEDFIKTIDRRIMETFKIDTPVGSFTLQGGYPDRENPYILGYTPLLSEADQTDEITEETIQLSPGMNIPYYLTGACYDGNDKSNQHPDRAMG